MLGFYWDFAEFCWIKHTLRKQRVADTIGSRAARYKLNQNEHYAEEDVHDEKYEQRHTLTLGVG